MELDDDAGVLEDDPDDAAPELAVVPPVPVEVEPDPLVDVLDG